MLPWGRLLPLLLLLPSDLSDRLLLPFRLLLSLLSGRLLLPEW